MNNQSSKLLSLIQLADNIWTVSVSHKFMGFDLGTRMNVIRIGGKELVLISPISLNDKLRAEVDSLGEVKFIVGPNTFHHLYLAQLCDVYPKAELWGAPGLSKKRMDLTFDGELGDDTQFGTQGELENFVFGGMPKLNETVFFHPESRTLMLTDLLFNFPKELPRGLKLFTRIFGLYGPPRVPWIDRYVFLRDKAKARESAKKVLSLDFDRVLLAHRDIIPTGGKDLVSKAFECFLS